MTRDQLVEAFMNCNDKKQSDILYKRLNKKIKQENLIYCHYEKAYIKKGSCGACWECED